MDNNCKLSICITVYNQIEIVKWNLDNLVQYHGNDIEIIINDDHSEDNIKELVDSYNDNRLKYFRNEHNLGHDLNILSALHRCSSEFAIVFRSKDSIIVDRIPDIINKLYSEKEIVYCLCSSVNENSTINYKLSDKLYQNGKSAVAAHFKLLVHPSGNIYNTKYLDLDSLEEFYNNAVQDKYGFIVHDLIRMNLAMKGDFLTCKEPLWIYSSMNRFGDIATNSAKNKKSVYHPDYVYPRYKCEYEYASTVLVCDSSTKVFLLRKIILRFFKQITYSFYISNRDKISQQHYNYKEISFRKNKERKNYRSYTRMLIKDASLGYKAYINFFLIIYSIKLKFYLPIRDSILNIVLKDKRIKGIISTKLKGL